MRGKRQRSDHFTRKARQQNFPARSVFKLEELDKKYRLIRVGNTVLDLGCAPGSWLMYASQQVGPKGLVVGVDRHGLKTTLPQNARFLKLDALSLEQSDLSGAGVDRFDIVLSDMAPHTSGNRFVDQQRSLRLFLRALTLAKEYSRAGGAFVGKIFQSEDLEEAKGEAESLFNTVRIARPKATKKQSYEVYVVCQGFIDVDRETGEKSDG